MNNAIFPNQTGYGITFKHCGLPVYAVSEFNFFRVLAMHDDEFMGITISDLHAGNLRDAKSGNRHCKLFMGQRVSYWTDRIDTGVSEILKHDGDAKRFVVFEAYDDASATFPVLRPREPLHIADGRNSDFARILDACEADENITAADRTFIDSIIAENLDAIAYVSHADIFGINYLFFEKGFRKLMLRTVGIGHIRKTMRSFGIYSNSMLWLVSNSDYDAILKHYGVYYVHMKSGYKLKFDTSYLDSSEYLERMKNHADSISFYLQGGQKQ